MSDCICEKHKTTYQDSIIACSACHNDMRQYIKKLEVEIENLKNINNQPHYSHNEAIKIRDKLEGKDVSNS